MCHFASPIIDPLPRPGAFASHAVTATTQAPIRRSDFGAADDMSLHRVIGARLEGRAHSRRSVSSCCHGIDRVRCAVTSCSALRCIKTPLERSGNFAPSFRRCICGVVGKLVAEIFNTPYQGVEHLA